MDTNKEPFEDKFHSFGKALLEELKDFLKCATITAIVAFVFTKFFILISIVPSGSMENTIPTGSIVIYSRLAYVTEEPAAGDIIAFHRSIETDTNLYTKRIVGVPGDIIEIINGTTYINKVKYEEPWLYEEPEALNFGPYVVPKNHYFCLGDNRNNSHDCRYWEEHFIKEHDIKGKSLFIYTLPNISKALIERTD